MLPSKNTVRLFNLTVELINDNTERFEQWCDLIDQGACLSTTLCLSNGMTFARTAQDLKLSSLEVVFSCWSWPQIAHAVNALAPLSDVFFENISQMSDPEYTSIHNNTLKHPFLHWQKSAKRGLYGMAHGEWGLWETLMYRDWSNCNVADLIVVMTALQKLPKITQHTLSNMATVATMGNSTTLEIGGMMAMTVGTDPAMRSCADFQTLTDLAQHDGALIGNWMKVQEAYTAIERNTLLHEVQSHGRTALMRKI